MGVIRHFSSSSYDKSSDKSTSIFSKWSEKSDDVSIRYESLPNPRPNNYKIIRYELFSQFLIVQIKYLDCINYEGNKILVFEKCTIDDLRNQKLIDPHFSENKKFHSPIARFEPTERGWNLAVTFVSTLI